MAKSVAVIVGSLRKDSINHKLMQALEKLAGDRLGAGKRQRKTPDRAILQGPASGQIAFQMALPRVTDPGKSAACATARDA